MEQKTLQLKQLRVLQEYMPKVRMIPDLIDRLENQGLKELLPSQQDAIMRLVEKSWKKDEILKKWNKNKSQSKPEPQVDSYFKSSYVSHVEERVPIGFQQKSTLTKPHNSYTMDVSKKSRMEYFDKLFDF
jgi:hypothetical protein